MRTACLLYYEKFYCYNKLKIVLPKYTSMWIIGVIFLCFLIGLYFVSEELSIKDLRILPNKYKDISGVSHEKYPNTENSAFAQMKLKPEIPISSPSAEIKEIHILSLEYVNTFPKQEMAEEILSEDKIDSVRERPKEHPKEEAKEETKEETDIKPGVPMAEITYTGNLRMDYCVGSEIDLNAIKVLKRADGINSEIPIIDCIVENVDTSTVGLKDLIIRYEDVELKIPYGVVEYKVIFNGNGGEVNQREAVLFNYYLDMDSIEDPIRLGKEFTGWYKDENCSIPFEFAAQGETVLNLYAGYREFPDLICDDNGYIIGYTGSMENITDELLRLPDDERIRGVGSNPFASLGEGIMEVFIPDNIVYLAPDAFDSLSFLFYIEVAKDNPVFFSRDGIVYYRETNEIAVFPIGRQWLN